MCAYLENSDLDPMCACCCQFNSKEKYAAVKPWDWNSGARRDPRESAKPRIVVKCRITRDETEGCHEREQMSAEGMYYR